MAFEIIFKIIIVLLGYLIGYWIAYLSRDELIMGRKYFRALVVLGILGSIWFSLTGYLAISWTCLFITTFSLAGLVKSFDKKWTKPRK